MFQFNREKKLILLFVWVGLIIITLSISFLINYGFDFTSFYHLVGQKKTYNNMVYDSFYNENDLDVKVFAIDNLIQYQYVRISGLKNKDIENHINTELYNCVMEQKNLKATSVFSFQKLNAFNILSVEVIADFSDEKVDSSLKKFVFNYDLTTGENINFEDLFTDDSNIFSILYSGYYDALSKNISTAILLLDKEENSLKNYEETGEKNQYYYGRTLSEIQQDKKNMKDRLDNIEELTIKECNNFLKSTDKQFYLTNYGIELLYMDNLTITLLSKKNIKYFAFYEKYVSSQSIYEYNKVGKKNLFLSSIANNDVKYSKIEQLGDYALIDYEKFYVTPLDYELKIVNKVIDKYKEKFNTNQFTYLNLSSSSIERQDKSLNSSDVNLVICTMNKEYYSKVYKNKLFNAKEFKSLGDSNEYYHNEEDDNFSCENEKFGIIIDLNGVVYENVEDIFVDDFDYKSFLIKTFVSQYHLDSNDTYYLNKDKYSFQIYNGSIQIDYDDYDFSSYLEISSIPSSYLKINL